MFSLIVAVFHAREEHYFDTREEALLFAAFGELLGDFAAEEIRDPGGVTVWRATDPADSSELDKLLMGAHD